MKECCNEKKKGQTEKAVKGGKAGLVFGNASGIGSIASAHNICHQLCLGAVALLSFFGIAANSDVLMWLEDYTLLFWGVGMAFLGVSIALLYKFPGCISRKAILANIGLLTAGIPLGQFQVFFWILGGGMFAGSAFWYFRDRLQKGEVRKWTKHLRFLE